MRRLVKTVRLVKTTAGSAVIDVAYTGTPGGLTVTTTPFDDEGWSEESKSWIERWGHHRQGEPLPAFLAVALRLPVDEAATLADAITGPWAAEWESRGGPIEAKKLGRLTFLVFVALAAAAVLAVVGVISAVWLLIQ